MKLTNLNLININKQFDNKKPERKSCENKQKVILSPLKTNYRNNVENMNIKSTPELNQINCSLISQQTSGRLLNGNEKSESPIKNSPYGKSDHINFSQKKASFSSISPIKRTQSIREYGLINNNFFPPESVNNNFDEIKKSRMTTSKFTTSRFSSENKRALDHPKLSLDLKFGMDKIKSILDTDSKLPLQNSLDSPFRKRILSTALDSAPFMTPLLVKDEIKYESPSIFKSQDNEYFQLNEDNLALQNLLNNVEGNRYLAKSLYGFFSPSYNSDPSLQFTPRGFTKNTGTVSVKQNDNVIIQPEFMQKTGSMCVTELWAVKSKKNFMRKTLSNVRVIHLRPIVVTQQLNGETLYKPQKIKDKIYVKERLMTSAEVRVAMERAVPSEKEILGKLKNSNLSRSPGRSNSPNRSRSLIEKYGFGSN